MTMQAEAAQGTTSSTELEPVAAGALALATSDTEFTALDLAKMLAGPAPELPADAPLPGAAPKVEFTDQLRSALKALPDLFGVVMPDAPGLLDRHQLKALTDETVAILTIQAELDKRLEAIKESVRNHQDAQAVQEERAEGAIRIAEGAAKGHLLVAEPKKPYSTPVDGYVDGWRQTYVSGKVTVTGSVLDMMEAEREIDRKTYLACTTEKRSYDPVKMAAFIKKSPKEGLRILARMTTRSAPSASLYAPKK